MKLCEPITGQPVLSKPCRQDWWLIQKCQSKHTGCSTKAIVNSIWPFQSVRVVCDWQFATLARCQPRLPAALSM